MREPSDGTIKRSLTGLGACTAAKTELIRTNSLCCQRHPGYGQRMHSVNQTIGRYPFAHNVPHLYLANDPRSKAVVAFGQGLRAADD
jgi:hypothetical protein